MLVRRRTTSTFSQFFLSIEDLPKSIVFKMISMEFKPTVDEQIQSEQFDEEQVKRLQSADFVRFKRARKAEKT